MPHLIISGAPSTGKSTLIRALRERYPVLEERCAFILDGGRWWMERYQEENGHRLRIDELSDLDRAQMQLEIFEYYTSRCKDAVRQGKTIVADAFFAEVLVYGMHCLDMPSLTLVEAHLCAYQQDITALILPAGQIALEHDGLRHSDEAYRFAVERDIISIYQKYGIPHQLVETANLEERVEMAAQLLCAVESKGQNVIAS